MRGLEVVSSPIMQVGEIEGADVERQRNTERHGVQGLWRSRDQRRQQRQCAGDQGRQQIIAHGEASPDDDAAARLCIARLDGARPVEYLNRLRQQALARPVELHPSSVAVEEAPPQRVFQLAQRLARGRLRQADLVRRLRDVFVAARGSLFE